MSSQIIKGKGVSPGIAIGKAIVFSHLYMPVMKVTIGNALIENEVKRFEEAIGKTRDQLLDLKRKLENKMGKTYSFLLEAQIAILEDPLFYNKALEKIKSEFINAEWAIQEVYDELLKIFQEIPDEAYRERFSDIEDTVNRVQYNLIGLKKSNLSLTDEKFIIVAYELTPSDLAEFHKENLMGFILEKGGRTSHTVILSKSLSIPAVINAADITKKIYTNELLIIDGYEGSIIINPSKLQLQEYLNKRSYYIERSTILSKLRELPAITVDNCRVNLLANIEFAEELDTVKESGADGIGLFRSEYIYLSHTNSLPTDEEHYNIYKKLAEGSSGKFVTIRTLDLGPDKFRNIINHNTEGNPFLGMRAIRLCLNYKDIFYAQLRAILRASAYGTVKILLPMISTVEEVIQVKNILKDIKADLSKEKIPFDDSMQIGCMIEVPAAALAVDLLSPEVDFFGVGTNDLIQYLLAIDRDNEKINYLYEPLHPIILRLLNEIINNASSNNKPIYICGEIASDPLYIMILLGLGYRTLSMTPTSIPVVKHLIRSISMKEAKELAIAALNRKTTAEVEELVLERMHLLFPQGFLSPDTLKTLLEDEMDRK